MGLEELKKVLHENVIEYSTKLGALDMEVIDAPKLFACNIVLKRSIVSIGYNYKDKIMIPASTLFCFIRPLKNNDLYFNLCEIMTMINPEDLRCTVFPYIESEKRMVACFHQLTLLIDETLPQMDQLISDRIRYDSLIKQRVEEFRRIYKISNDLSDYSSDEAFVIEWQDLYEDYLVCNMTNNDRYQKFLQGNYAKAKKGYQKVIAKGKEFEYEQLIYNFMLRQDHDFEAIPSECYAYKNAKSLDSPMLMIKTMLALYPIFVVFYSLFGFVVQTIISKGAVFCDVMGWYYNLFFALVPSFLLGLSYRGKIFKLFQRDELAAFDDISMTKKQRRVYLPFIWLIVTVCVLFTLTLNIFCTSFYEDKIVSNDTAGLLDMGYEEYCYKDVEKIYYIKGRYNDWDEYINRGSYVLVYSDGRQLDLDLILTKEEAKKYMLPYIDKKVEVVNSDRNVK